MEVPPGILKTSRTQVAPLGGDVHPVTAYPLVHWEDQRHSSSISFISSSMTISSLVDSEDYKDAQRSQYDLDKDLEQLDRNAIFIRQVPEEMERYINVPNRYEIVSSSGERLYDVMETTDGVTRRLFRRNQPFCMKMTNNYGEFICDIIGDPGVGGIGAYVKLRRGMSVWGKVVQTYPFFACCNFSPSYNVYNHMDKTMSKIVWKRGRLSYCLDEETSSMQVYSSAATNKRGLIGSINRQESQYLGNYTQQQDTYTLSFLDGQMDTMHRALLVAAVILLDFQFFEGKEGSAGSKSWRLIVCCLLMGLVLALATVVAIVVLFMAKNVKV